MKISKKALLTTWSFFSVAALWLMFVSGAWDNLFSNPDKELEINPSNAIQHFQNVKIIATGNTDAANATISKNWNWTIRIATDDNFVISTGEIIKPCDWNNDGIITEWDIQSFNLCIVFGSCTDNKYDLNNDWIVNVTDVMICTHNYLYKQDNKITQWVKWSSILWWFGNRIKKWIYETILWWIFNAINTGDSNSILWWKNNSIENGTNSVIFWWNNNKITWARWENSAIIWSNGNTINISDATIVWNNNTVDWQYSIAMWKKAKVSGKNSFLWSDGRNSELSKNNVFAVIWDNGMVVNSTEAHDIAKLTISGSLVVFDDKNAPECTDETKWVLKVITGDNYNNEQECFCSCDGSWRNALHEWTRCTALCAYGTWLEAECGEVKINCGDNPYSYTWDELSGACAKWELVWWTGAFFVTTNKDWNTLTDYINRSCQVTDWHVSQCYQKLNESCPNINTWYECLWSYENVTWHIIINEEVPTDSASFWTYDPDLKWPCTYKCDQYGEWDPIEEKCTFHSCTWELSEGAQLNDEMVLPMDDNTEYFYDETSTGACAYTCSLESWYRYDPITDKCVPAGCDIAVTEVKDLEVFILSNTWNISHYTMMDRNLWATETFNQDDTSPNEESYGCYFQWWNIHPFNKDRSGSLNTTESLTNTTDYGPNRTRGYYSNPKYYCTSGSGDIMYPRGGSNIPKATRFWWWWFTSNWTSYSDWRWTDWTDIDRQWPCPEWYHIPRGSEMESILNEWKEVSEYPTEGFSDITLQKSKEFASDLLLPFAWYWGFSCSWARTVWLGKRGSYAIWDYYKRTNQLHVWISTAGNGAYLFLNWPAFGFSMRCVKNDISANQKITIHANGWSTAIITIDWETPENGKIITLENPIKTGYSFLWWYLDSTFNTSINEWDDIANNSHLYAKWEYKDCDMEQTVTQDLELFIISSTGEISHYTMMDRNLWAFEVYNQKGESAQNARSYWCHFQWWNNNWFSLWTPSTRYWINPTSYSPSTYSNNKIYCKNRDGSTGDVSELDEDDLNEGWNILGSQYAPINYHLWWWWYILSNRVFRTWYWNNGSNVDRRWPCPEWYHVPGWIEMDDFVNNWNDASSSRWAIWKNFASDLLMPFGRYIEVFCGEQNRLKVWWWIWLSDHIYKNYGWAGGWHYFNHIGKFTDNSAITFSRNGLAHGFPVRCVKNDFSANQKITIHANGWTGAVIGIDWESEGSGKITALSTPSKNWIQFLWWYTDSSFATDSKVTTWDYISNGGDLYAKWDECRIEDTAIQDLDIYILWSTWNTSHYVMMDRNLWATEVYNQDYGSSNQTSFGCYFQWWNNYPFHKTNIAKTQVQANVNGYWPSNYYSHGLLFCNTDDQPTNRFSSEWSDWKDLRWWITNTEISKKWPCPEWYHIPHNTEIQKLINEWKSAATITWWRQLANDMLTPFAGGISPRCNNGYANDNKAASFWMANAGSSADNICHLSLWNFTNGEVVSCRTNSAVHAFAVRCVKNDMDTAPQKITIHANGWTGAVISIDWETAENGKIISISEPRKNGTEFQWWYLDEWFTNPVGDYISNGSHLYAKWNECNISDTQVQDLEVFFIWSTWDISHYTLMDRNLWAREAYNQNYSSQNEESYGCYFQWWNNYPFNRWRSGASYTTGILTNTKDYGPGTANGYYYNPMRHCSSNGVMYTLDGSNVPFATWFWWWWFTSDWVNYRYDTNPPRWSRWTDWTDIDRQWPCPTGYHVPRGREMESILSGWKEASNYPNESGFTGIELQKSKVFASDLLLPFAWFMGSSCSTDYNSKGTMWSYLIWDYYKRTNHFHIWPRNDKPGIHLVLNGPAYWFSMRCVKNDISANQKVTIHANGWTGAVIAIDWETDWTGKITTLWTPTKGWIQFQWWFSDEWLTNPVNAGDYISSGSHLYAKWNECNISDTQVQDLEVFFIWSTWDISHYTLMDRNLWATEAFNQNISSPNKSSFGCYFQRWNNYPFNIGRSSSQTFRETLSNTKNYGPITGYYHNSNHFCNVSGDPTTMYPVDGSGYPFATWLWWWWMILNDWVTYRYDTNPPRWSWWTDGSDIDRQWPCPEWYHIPRGVEMNSIMQEWKDISDYPSETWALALQKSKDFASNLLLPFAWWNSSFCWYWHSWWGRLWKYLISDYYKVKNHLHIWESDAGNGLYFFMNWPAYGYSMRCVKNNISANEKITIHANGWTKAVISIDWESDWTGKITTLWTPTKGWIQFQWWFSDEWLTNPVNAGDYISSGSHLYAKWLGDQEFEDLELYFLEDDWNIIHYTMMDRNMWATEIYNQNFDNSNTESFGNHYQWGNNWWFKPCIALWSQCGTFPWWESYTTNERVQKSEWSLNTKSRYVSNVYREINSSPFNWMADANAVANDESTDMWWWKGDTKTSNWAWTVSDRQWPCPDEYYVPSTLNWGNIIWSWKKSTPDTKDGIKMASDLLLPVAGARDYQSKYVQNQGSFGRYWSSSLRTDENSRAFSLRFASWDILPQQPLNISRGASVRCIKGVTNPQTINIHANWWIKAVIAIDGGKITALWEPTKSWYIFSWWYSDEWLTNPVNTGDYISSGANLYAKWIEATAILLPWNDFNSEIIRLAGSASNITQILYTWNMPAGTNTWIVSVDWFEPVIAWYKDGKIYLTTDAVKMFLNEDSSAMFSGLSNVTKIDTTNRNTSNVTDMRFMFYKCNNLTWLDVSNWKTSNVTSMRNMFRECNSLTELDVSHWKTSNVTDMGYMFNKCYNLESLDVSHWDTSNVTNMSAMFNKCYDLKSLDISDWNTSNVTDMWGMFQYCESLTNLDVSSWDTSKVNYMNQMFLGCSNLTGLDVSNLNTSSVTNMVAMFSNCINLTWLDVSNWDTSNVTDMQIMFWWGPDVTMNLEYLDVSNWDTHNVTNMEAMFQNCSNLTSLDVSNWDTSSVTKMDNLFYKCTKLENLDVSDWNTSNVTDMKFMFNQCKNLTSLDVSHFDTSNVTNMRAMFQNCNNLTELDVSKWNTSKVTNMSYMFNLCHNLTTIYASTWFVTTAVTNSDSMFEYDTKLVWWNGTTFSSSHIDKEYAKIDKPWQTWYFTELTYATLLPWKEFNQTIKRLAGQSSATHSTTNTTITQILYTWSMPTWATTWLVSTQWSIPVIAWYLNGTIYLTTEADRIYLNSDSSYMFYDMKWLTKVDFSGWNTSDVTRMSYMFYGCNSLTELDLSNWDTSNVTTVAGLFEYCSSLTGLDLSTWNTSKMTSMFSMFYNCTGMQTLNMSGWDFSHLPSGRWIYDELYFRNLTNLRSFNLSNAKFSWNMYDAFYNMTNLREINLDGADVSNVVGMNHMFWNCTNLETVSMSGRNTSNVTAMDSMFDGCTRLTGLDLSSWNTSNVTNMLGMFKNCKNLTTIYANTWFITNQVATSTSMFYNDKKLVWWNGTIYDELNTNKTYARIDKPWQKWYFTEK